MARFAPLRCHSWYSLHEGADSPAALLQRAAECGYDALALTDCNSLAGAVEFVEAARAVGVRPILGARLSVQNQTATALIAEPSGWRSLCRIISRINLRTAAPFTQTLAENAAGLQLLIDNAFVLKAPLTDAYRGRLWTEIVRPGATEAKELALVETGSRLGLKCVASLGAHFALPGGLAVYRLLAALYQGKTLEDLPGRLSVQHAHHLATPAEVTHRFRDSPDALANAGRLAEMCRSDVLPRGLVLPPATVPEQQDALGYLRLLCERALSQRTWTDAPSVLRRLEQELAVIAQNDLAMYFLLAGEIAAEARQRQWPFMLRGSAAASLVLHLLQVSDVNPLTYGLRLERFLHPGRADLPDIDLEFADQCRGEVYAWAEKNYGVERIARVGSWHRYRPRSAFAAAALAHGVTQAQLGALTEALGDAVEGLEQEEVPETLASPPSGFPLEPPAWPKLVASARLLLGRPHQLLKHPSGCILTNTAAEDHVPLQRGERRRLTQLGQAGVEAIGLLKLDWLSSHALSALAEARQHLQSLAPPDAPALACEDSDPAVLQLLARGDTLGVAHLETPGMRLLLRQLRPQRLLDLVQALAVTRPGPLAADSREVLLRRRVGSEVPTYPHPALEPVLRENNGVLLYEDDVLGVIEALTSLSAPEADSLRRALADRESATEAGVAFLSCCERAGVKRPAAEGVLGQLLKLQGYTFCKAHAVAVALVAWGQCHLNAHEPLSFWTATLNHHEGCYPRRVLVEAAKRAGLSVFLPCVNRSNSDFTQEVSGIRCGLNAVWALARSAVEATVEERQRGGSYQSLSDFRRRVTMKTADVALLIRVGAFDFTGRSRAALLREAEATQARPPAGRTQRPDFEPWPLEGLLPKTHPLADQWREEWDLLGFLAAPSLMSLVRACVPPGLADSRSLPSCVGEQVQVAGLVATAKEPTGADRPNLTLEDEWGLVEVSTRDAGDMDLEALGPVVLVAGRVEEKHRVPVLVATRLERPLPGAGRAPTRQPVASVAKEGLNGAPHAAPTSARS